MISRLRRLDLMNSFSGAVIAALLCIAAASGLRTSASPRGAAWGHGDGITAAHYLLSSALHRGDIDPRSARRHAPSADLPLLEAVRLAGVRPHSRAALAAHDSSTPAAPYAPRGYDATAPPRA